MGDEEIDLILNDIRSLISEDGRVIIAICNPFDLEATRTKTHEKGARSGYNDIFTYEKRIRSTGRVRLEHHRPIDWYEKRFLDAGLDIESIDESSGIDIERLSPGSELLFFTLRPIPMPSLPKVSLLIKASPMEWRTIDAQVRHIISQLEGPERFLEKIVVTDRWAGPFSRQYDSPDYEVLINKLDELVKKGVIDRVLVPDESRSSGLNKRWFGIDSSANRSANGQPVHLFLHGLEQCQGDYVLQLDSDCLLLRRSRSDDYLGRMTGVMERDENAITVSMPIPYDSVKGFTKECGEGKWRTEVRCCLLSKPRLLALLPLDNRVQNGLLALPWHRSLDKRIAELELHSYRGGDPSTSFVHVPNDRKKDITEWFNIMQRVEEGKVPQIQLNQVDLVGDMSTWLPSRKEGLILLLRGRNVPIPLVRRCLESIERQSIQDWGLLMIDAGSGNSTADFLKKVVRPRYQDRVTLLQNLVPLTPMENIDIAIKRLCKNLDSIIVMVDLDDALIGSDALGTVLEAYEGGADLTVGSMLRTDKHKEYPVDLVNPRASRGGNVWQHLRTFKNGLYTKVPVDDFHLDGHWVPHAEDWAFMVPMVEMSKRPVYINRQIYFYEPSPEKACRSVAERERIIAIILAKNSLKGVGE